MKVTIIPGSCTGASVTAPPSKSMAHRMLLCAGLADGISTIKGVALSEDILATIDCLQALGAEFAEVTDAPVSGRTVSLKVKGTDPRTATCTAAGCRESGSTLRFMIPLAVLTGNEVFLSTSGRLAERPLTVYEDLFRIERTSEGSTSGVLVSGDLTGGEYVLDGSISSQFISGMLFAIPLTGRDSTIKLLPPIESRPYIDMTLSALRTFGVCAEWQSTDQADSIIIPGGQSYKPADVCVEGDWSNSAFFLAMGHEVTGLRDDSLQGDKICAEYFKALEEGSPHLDISSCPDLGPVLMAFAAMHNGCTLTGTRRLRIKESDRGAAMKDELAKFGVSVEISENDIKVGSGAKAPSEILYGHNDHRIVMALSVICAVTGGTIDGAEAVSKSFPDYFDRLAETGTTIIRA